MENSYYFQNLIEIEQTKRKTYRSALLETHFFPFFIRPRKRRHPRLINYRTISPCSSSFLFILPMQEGNVWNHAELPSPLILHDFGLVFSPRALEKMVYVVQGH